MERKIIKSGLVDSVGFDLSIELEETKESEDDCYYIVLIDSVEWFVTHSLMHGVILYELLKEHVHEYMHYESTK